MKNTKTKSACERADNGFGRIAIAGVLLALLVGIAFAVANAQGYDSDGNPVNTDWDAQDYVSITGVSVDEAKRRLQLQDIARELDVELSTKEAKTFAGLWIEHTPNFRVVVQFTRDSNETIKPYLKRHAKLANIVEVRTVNVSLADLQWAQADASSSVRASGIPVDSGINVYNNSVELYMAMVDWSRFDNALQRREIRLPDKVMVITVEALAEPTANIYGGLPLSTCTSGFSVKKGWWPLTTKGITTAGHCSNSQSYNGKSLSFKSERVGGSYDIQWHIASGYTVTNEIRYKSDGSTRPIYEKKSQSNQIIGEYVCKYGMTTNYTCGQISDKNFNPNYVWPFPDTSSTFIRVDNTAGWNVLSGDGDSGSPWFFGTTAYGTLSGSPGADPNDAIYMAVNYVESGLGVTVMTSP